MPFQISDVTGGQNVPIIYIDNSGNMGLGSLPVNGQALTVQGNGFLNPFGDLGNGVLGPGSQAGYEGAFQPGAPNAVVTISTAQQPTVSASLPPISITTTEVVFVLPGQPISNTITYSIW